MNNGPKKKLCIIITHFGSARYFAKLASFLPEYDASFLITPKTTSKCTTDEIKDIQDYARERNISIFKIGSLPKLNGIPFVSILRSWIEFKKDARRFFDARLIDALLGSEDTNLYSNALFLEARRRGIKTAILQWAVSGKNDFQKNSKRSIFPRYHPHTPLHKSYEWILRHISNLLGITSLHGLIPGQGTAERFGVLNRPSFELFASLGISEKKMQITGSADWELATDVQKTLDADTEQRSVIARENRINLEKKQIMVFSTPFNIKGVIEILSDEEQLAHYRKLIRAIRAVAPSEQADIHLKIHHREHVNTYAPLRDEYDVILHDKDAINEHLVYFADLYTAEGSTTNFIPMVMEKDVIFTNMHKLDHFESCRSIFGIERFITNWDEYAKTLSLWKDGTLEKQYKKGCVKTDTVSKIQSLIAG